MTNESGSSLKINIDNYNGPLEVLLDLAKSQKVDLADISITQLADQFIDFINSTKKVNLDIEIKHPNKQLYLYGYKKYMDDFDKLFKGNKLPKVALLNIGSEEIKGNSIIKNTFQKLNEEKNEIYEFHGFIEGNQIMDGNVNVIVTDGFTGNVALKTAEGTANFITSELKQALTSNIIGKMLMHN